MNLLVFPVAQVAYPEGAEGREECNLEEYHRVKSESTVCRRKDDKENRKTKWRVRQESSSYWIYFTQTGSSRAEGDIMCSWCF